MQGILKIKENAMDSIRPYVVDNYDAIDLNMLVRMYIFEETKIALIMYYAEPIVLEFKTVAEAKMKFNELMAVWRYKDKQPFDVDEALNMLRSFSNKEGFTLDGNYLAQNTIKEFATRLKEEKND